MRAIRRLAAAAALAIGVSGCTLPQLAATVTEAKVSPATLAKLQGYCRSGQGLIRLARSPVLLAAGTAGAAAGEIGAAVGDYCGTLLAGSVPTTTDANTITWLPQNLAGLASHLALIPR